MKAPTGRYWIVERGRKLVTIDTWAEGNGEISSAPRASETTHRTAQNSRTTVAPTDILTMTDLYWSALFKGRAGLSGRRLITQHWFDPQAYRAVRLTGAMADQLVMAARGSIALPFAVLIVWQIIGWGSILISGWLVFQIFFNEAWQQKVGAWLERGEVEQL